MSDYFSFNSEKQTKHLWLYFSVLFLLNFFLKTIHLDFSPFWYDEIISIQSASLDFGHIKHVSEWDKNPPFYYYFLSVWVKLFNDSEFFARLLSVIFSSLSAGVLFLFANKYFNKTTAIITSLFYLSSNIIFFYSHEARAYSLVVLLSLISTYLYFNFKNNPSWKNIILLGLVNFLLIYTHYIAGLVVFFEAFLMLAFFEKKQTMRFSYSLLITILFILIRFTKKQFLLILDFNSSESTFWLQKSSIKYLIEVVSTFLFNEILIIPFLGMMLLGIFLIFKKNIKQSYFAVIYAILISVGSVFILFILGKITPIFLDRYLIFTLPFFFLLIAIGLSFLNKKNIAIILSFSFFIFSAFKINYKTDKGMDYKSAVYFLQHIKKESDLIIVKTKDIKPLFCYYYDSDFLSHQKKELPINENIIFCTSWNDINREIKSFKRIIVVDSFEDLNQKENEFVTKLSSERNKYFSLTCYKGVKITFYK